MGVKDGSEKGRGIANKFERFLGLKVLYHTLGYCSVFY